jgi:hypothetical protein
LYVVFIFFSSLFPLNLAFRPNGRIISVPLHNVLVGALKPGDIVTFSFERHARKTDMVLNPTVVRIRADVSWEDVVTNAAKDAHYLNGMC